MKYILNVLSQIIDELTLQLFGDEHVPPCRQALEQVATRDTENNE